jgi:hypothetical protein
MITLNKVEKKINIWSGGKIVSQFTSSARIYPYNDTQVIIKEDDDQFIFNFSDLDKANCNPVITSSNITSFITEVIENFFPNASSGGTEGGGGAWGSITGTLSSQTDLQSALNAKVDESKSVLANANFDSETIASATTITPTQNFIHLTGTTNIATIATTNFDGEPTILYITSTSSLNILTTGNVVTKNGLPLSLVSGKMYAFAYSQTNSKWYQINYDSSQITGRFDVPQGNDFIDDASLEPLHSFTSGGTTTTANREAGVMGIGTLSRGVTAGNRCGYFLGDGTSFDQITFGAVRGNGFYCRLKIPVLSNGTNRFDTWIGYFDDNNASFTDMLAFKINDNENSGKVQLKREKAGGGETLIDTGVTLVADTWYEFNIEQYTDGTFKAFINGTQVTATLNSTNCPFGTSEAVGGGVILKGVLGTGDVTVRIDSMWFYNI